MEKILKLITIVIFKMDTALYKTFGFVSSFRRRSWARQNRRLQSSLDIEHSRRDYFNTLNDTNYTTKQALALED